MQRGTDTQKRWVSARGNDETENHDTKERWKRMYQHTARGRMMKQKTMQGYASAEMEKRERELARRGSATIQKRVVMERKRREEMWGGECGTI